MVEKHEFGVAEFVEKNKLAEQILGHLVGEKLWKGSMDFSNVACSDLPYSEKKRFFEECCNKFYDELFERSKVVVNFKENSVTIKLKQAK